MADAPENINEEVLMEKTVDASAEDKVNESETENKEPQEEVEADDKDDNEDDNEQAPSADESDEDPLMVIEMPDGLTILDSPSCCSHHHDQDGLDFSTDDAMRPDDFPDVASDGIITEELVSNLAQIRRTEVLNLPETVTKLTTPDGCIVYLVGTAHFSKESQEDVAKTIQAVQPDVVVVELCKSRVDILKYDEEFLLREAKNIDMKKLKFSIKQSGLIGGIMQVLLLSMSAHITKQLGMAPGGEFRAAFNEARKIHGCQIHLGDRPIQVTLSRAMASLSIWQKTKLAWHLLTSKQAISEEDVERCKQKDLLAEMLAEMTGDFPLLYKVFVSERDRYLAKSLRLSAMPIVVRNQNKELKGIIPSVVVGVVGIGHVVGITEHFDKEIDIQELLIVPPASRASKLVIFSVKAFFGVFLAWGSYKLLKWTNLSQYMYIPWYH